MKVLMYSHTFLPKIGGREIVVYELSRALQAQGHDVRIVGPNWQKKKNRVDPGVSIHRYPRSARNIASLRGYRATWAELQLLAPLLFDVMCWGCDVIHAHSLYPAGQVLRKLKSFLPGTPTVITPHGIDINTVPDAGYGMRLVPELETKIGQAIDAADAVTAISDGVETSLLEAGADKAKTVRINNGINLQRFNRPFNAELVRTELGIGLNKKLILTVGNYSPMKGHDDLVRLMPAVLQAEPDACLVIAGGGTDALEPLITSLGIRDSVVLTGTITPVFAASSTDLMAGLYQDSAVYVSASNAEGAEGLSLSLLDAMAAGLGVVATDIVGNRDVIRSEHNGILVAPGDTQAMVDALVRLLSDQATSHDMGSAGRELAAPFSWDAVAQQYVTLYESVSNGAAMQARR